MADSKQPARTASRGRMVGLVALLAVIAVVAVWLANCIPGFGMGSSGDGDGKAGTDAPKAEKADAEKAEPAKPEPEQPKPEKLDPPQVGEPKPEGGGTLTVNIGAAGCYLVDTKVMDCAKMCEQAELFEGIDDAVLEVDGASHGSVVAMLDCLKAKGIDKVAVRRESP